MPPPAHPRRRTTAHAWAETRGLLGRHTAARRDLDLHTADGVRLRATRLPGPAGDGPGPAVVLLHGFAAHRRKPRFAWPADELAARFTVLAPDLRGHGQSDGTSGLGSDEHLDVAAAVGHLRERGHAWVAVVGVSMGATSAAHAAARGVIREATVLVSGPAHIELEPTTRPMQQLRRIWHAPGGRAALRTAVGVSVAPHRGWRPPPDPVDAIAHTAGPVLVVHGADDHFFPADHGRATAAAAAAGTLWLEPRFGHAEDGFHDPFGRRLRRALAHAHHTGAFPEREELPWRA